MATTDATKTQTADISQAQFGAYGNVAGVPSLTPQVKNDVNLGLTDREKGSLKEFGVTTTTPDDFRDVWAKS